MPKRRAFLASLGVAAAGFAIDADELRAAPAQQAGPWDTSWIPRVESAKYRVVFNATDINDGAALDLASTFLDHYHEVHGTTDAETRPVIVFRRLGVPMAVNDAMWERYDIGENRKINDPVTHAPAKRNVFWKAGPGGESLGGATIESLNARGLVSLVCNIALNNFAGGLAKAAGRDVEDVRAEMRANLVPGAIRAPSGIYALIRTQNAGCAYMQN